MASGCGALSRLGARLSWALLKRQRTGVDELGNVYYRKLEKNAEGNEVERRFVKYGADIDPTQLPAEWHQWLHKARAEPPTEEVGGGSAGVAILPCCCWCRSMQSGSWRSASPAT